MRVRWISGIVLLGLAAGLLAWNFLKPAGNDTSPASNQAEITKPQGTGLADKGIASKPASGKAAQPAVPVKTATASLRDVPMIVAATGRTAAFESVTLKSRIDGQVVTTPFAEGRHVKRGDILVQLDPADFAARLRQAEANQARDQAQLAKSQADVERYLALKNKGFISEEKLNDVRTTQAANAAAVSADQAAVDVARLQLSYCTIRSTIDGIVGARLVFPGTGVKANDTALAVVNRIKPLLVAFSVPEKHLTKIRQIYAGGTSGKAGLVAMVSPPDNPALTVSGKVDFLDNAVDTATGTIQMKATLPNTDEALSAGQFVNVRLTLDTLRQVVSIPTEAVQQGPNGLFVYTVSTEDTAQLRAIEVLTSQNEWAVVASGLEAGETVVTDGQLRLTPGARIKRAESRPSQQ